MPATSNSCYCQPLVKPVSNNRCTPPNSYACLPSGYRSPSCSLSPNRLNLSQLCCVCQGRTSSRPPASKPEYFAFSPTRGYMIPPVKNKGFISRVSYNLRTTQIIAYIRGELSSRPGSLSFSPSHLGKVFSVLVTEAANSAEENSLFVSYTTSCIPVSSVLYSKEVIGLKLCRVVSSNGV